MLLRLLNGGRAGEWIALPESGAWSVGRSPGCDVLLEEPGVSGHHARLLVDANACRLADNGSTNGTRCNGTRLTEMVTLADGDRLAFGPVECLFLTGALPEADDSRWRAQVAAQEQEVFRLQEALHAARQAPVQAAARSDMFSVLLQSATAEAERRWHEERAAVGRLQQACALLEEQLAEKERLLQQWSGAASSQAGDDAPPTLVPVVASAVAKSAEADARRDMFGADGDTLADWLAARLEGPVQSLSRLRHEATLLDKYMDDGVRMAQALARIDYTRLEPAQQRLVRDLVDAVQPELWARSVREAMGGWLPEIAHVRQCLRWVRAILQSDAAEALDSSSDPALTRVLTAVQDCGVRLSLPQRILIAACLDRYPPTSMDAMVVQYDRDQHCVNLQWPGPGEDSRILYEWMNGWGRPDGLTRQSDSWRLSLPVGTAADRPA